MAAPLKGPGELILEQFRIEQVLARTAVLYQVRELHAPGRAFMAKRIRPEHAQRQDVLDWFSRETQISEQLAGHPHIVRFLPPLRTDKDGVNYCFFEFVPGGALAELLRAAPDGRLSYPQTLRWAAQVAAAMEFATKRERNRRGVFVHRDLDPSNVLLTSAGSAKVNDWGLGKNILEPDDRIFLRSIEDLEGRAAGKSPFMPPEQFPPLRGADYAVGGDVYYLGGLIAQMLAGVPVNPPAETRRLQLSARTFDEVGACLAAHHAREVLPQLAQISPRRGLVDLVADCIAVDPSARIADFALVRRRLDELAEEIRAGLLDPRGLLACEACGFVAAGQPQACPVCRSSGAFRSWNPAGFDLEVLREQASVPDAGTSTPPERPPEPLVRPTSSPRPNALVGIPAGPAVLGAKATILANLARGYGLSGPRLEQFTRFPERSLPLPGFAISRHAVSNGEYEEFVRATGWRRPGQGADGDLPPGDLPVVNVDFADAEAFCQWKRVRLPSNDEWERAARGPSGRAYPWGDAWEPRRRCNTLELHRATSRQTVPVWEFPESASPDGIVNMAGNVWEWVDGGEGRMKHSRGGSWRYQGDLFALTWFRLPTDPEILQDDVGFRYAADRPEVPMPREALRALQPIPAGTYSLGVSARRALTLAGELGLSSSDAAKLASNEAHSPRLEAFRMRRYPVTNEEYFEFVQSTRYPWPPNWTSGLLAWSERPFLAKYRFHPVTRVTYRDAAAYCAWAGGRLPTADEWEAAARGTDGRSYPWGDGFDPGRCNTAESGIARTNRVDEFPGAASPFGCVDMAGNVSEWVAPGAGASYGVRGGSFEDSGAVHALAFLHLEATPDAAAGKLGFRCVFPG